MAKPTIQQVRHQAEVLWGRYSTNFTGELR